MAPVEVVLGPLPCVWSRLNWRAVANHGDSKLNDLQSPAIDTTNKIILSNASHRSQLSPLLLCDIPYLDPDFFSWPSTLKTNLYLRRQPLPLFRGHSCKSSPRPEPSIPVRLFR
jgi:hypothetical protein